MRKWQVVTLLVVTASMLGATVFREPVAFAAQLVNATITSPLDPQGDVAVHEQGVASVQVTNAELAVRQGTPFSIMVKKPADRFTVPADKRLVIEYVNSFSGTAQVASLIVGHVEPGQGGIPEQDHALRGLPYSDGYIISERVTIHAGPGKQVVFFYNDSSRVTFQGYLFDA